jgi:hypothetical protein
MSEITTFDVLGAGAGGPLPPPSPWIAYGTFLSYGGAVVIGTPSGGAQSAGSLNLQSLYLNGTQFLPSNYLPIAGGTLTGPLMLNADPTAAFGASTKGYVDARAWQEAPSDGSRYGRATVAGSATWVRDPVQTDAPSDGNLYARSNAGWLLIPAVTTAPADGSTYGTNNNAWSNVIDAGPYPPGTGKWNVIRLLRSNSVGVRPLAGRTYGEFYANFADLQIGAINASAANQDFLAVRIFSTAATYAVGDFVTFSGAMYHCITAITTPGAWAPASWSSVTTAANLGTMAAQNANAVNISGGAINGTAVGQTTPSVGQFTSVTTLGTNSQLLVQDLAAGGTAYIQMYRSGDTCYLGIATDTSQNIRMSASSGTITMTGGLTVSGNTVNFTSINTNAFTIGGSAPLIVSAPASSYGYLRSYVSGQRLWSMGGVFDSRYVINDESGNWLAFAIFPGGKYFVFSGPVNFNGDAGPQWGAAGFVSSSYYTGGQNNGIASYSGTNGFNVYLARVDNTMAALMMFNYGATTNVGFIATNGTTTSYNTTSDVRLKTGIRALSSEIDVGALIDAIEPVAFEWKTAPDHPTGHGFVAQDLAKIAPLAVTEAVDPLEGFEGSGRPWGVDHSKLVPYLVAELQALRKRVAELEAR